MDKQTKIDTLIQLLFMSAFVEDLSDAESKAIKDANEWLQELEQSNNKDNIDNWTNRELFDYCVENGLINDISLFGLWSDNQGRQVMNTLISTYKSQK